MNPQFAALYGRVSTGQQAVDTQEIRGKEYLCWKQLQLAAEFYDDDVSGSVAVWDRPSGRQLYNRLQAGDIRHLVVVKLDRLGRSAVDLLKTVAFLDSHRIILHIVDMGGDSLSTQGAAGRLMFTVLAGMAEYERELIRSRITDKLDVKRGKGELIGTVPYGWNAEETGELSPKGVKIRRLVPNPDEQKWIIHMVHRRNAGWGYHSIAKELNEFNVPTKRGKGEVLKLRCKADPDGERSETRFTSGKWQAGNVAHILNNKTTHDWITSLSPDSAANPLVA